LYKIKKANPVKWICLYGKRYHNQLKRCQNSRYIAGIKSLELIVSNHNCNFYATSSMRDFKAGIIIFRSIKW